MVFMLTPTADPPRSRLQIAFHLSTKLVACIDVSCETYFSAVASDAYRTSSTLLGSRHGDVGRQCLPSPDCLADNDVIAQPQLKYSHLVVSR